MAEDENVVRLRAEINDLIAERRRCGDDADPRGSAGAREVLLSIERMIKQREAELALCVAASGCPSLAGLRADPGWVFAPHGGAWALERRIDDPRGGWFEIVVIGLPADRAGVVLREITNMAVFDSSQTSVAAACELAARWAGNLAAGRVWSARPKRLRRFATGGRVPTPPGPRLRVLLQVPALSGLLTAVYGPALQDEPEVLRAVPGERLHLVLAEVAVPAAELGQHQRDTIAAVVDQAVAEIPLDTLTDVVVEEARLGASGVWCGLGQPGPVTRLAGLVTERLGLALPGTAITPLARSPEILLAYGVRDSPDLTDLYTQLKQAPGDDIAEEPPGIARLGATRLVIAEVDPAHPDLWQPITR